MMYEAIGKIKSNLKPGAALKPSDPKPVNLPFLLASTGFHTLQRSLNFS